jgi:hypothetical protein
MEHEPATPAFHARVRWGNVAKALALAAVVALVVAWPRLRAPDPEIPPGAAVPVRQAPATTPAPMPQRATTTTPEPVEQEHATPLPRRRTNQKRRHTPRKAPEAHARASPAPVGGPPSPAPTWRPPARAPAEFSVE